MMTEAKTVDFGAPDHPLAHTFHVSIPATKNEPVAIIESYGYEAADANDAEEHRANVPRQNWSAIAEPARRQFNERLKAENASTGRWKSGITKVERLLGKELCVLAWAAEQATPDELPVICARWSALRPEERWWLFAQTVSETGLAGDVGKGWRKALHVALSFTPSGEERPRRVRRRPDKNPMQTDLPV